MIEITVNGEPQTAPQGQTILGLLRQLDLDPARVAVELDRRIVKQPNWQETSSSALFVYSLAKAARLGIIDNDYLDVAKKGWAGVKTKIALSNNNNTVKVQGTVVGMSIGGVYNAYTNADFRTDLTSGPLPAPAESCVGSTYVKFTSPPLVCKYSYVRDNVPQGLGAAMLAATEMEY